MVDRLRRIVRENQILTALAVIAICWVIYRIQGVLTLLFVSYIIANGLLPFVRYLIQKKVPKTLAVLIPCVVLLAIILLLIVPLIPVIIKQLIQLFTNFPKYLDQAAKLVNLNIDAGAMQTFVTDHIDAVSQNALTVTTSVFQIFYTLITIFFIVYFLLVDYDRFRQVIISLFPKADQKSIEHAMDQTELKLGAWLRGQLVLSLVIGVGTWIAYTVLALDFALPLAIFAGIMEVIPTLGPIIGIIPAIIVALTISPTKAILVTVLYLIIQMVESNYLVPKIMSQAVGLHPLVVMLGIIIGGNLLGFTGAILSIPFILMCGILFNYIRR